MALTEMNNCDAYIEMHVTDAIEKSRNDKLESDLDWLAKHGFIRKMEGRFVKFVNCNFRICDMTLDIMLEYNQGNDYWTCEGITSDIELWFIINGLVVQLLNRSNGMQVLPRPIDKEFSPDMSRIGVMSNMFSKWLSSYKAGNYRTAQGALESYCRRVVSSIEAFKTECKSHSSDWCS